jgi:hypothetical protein
VPIRRPAEPNPTRWPGPRRNCRACRHSAW